MPKKAGLWPAFFMSAERADRARRLAAPGGQRVASGPAGSAAAARSATPEQSPLPAGRV